MTAETLVEFDAFGFVKDYLCPKCKGKVKLDHEDDIGQKWFKCEKCGEQSTRLKTEAKKEFEKSIEEWKFKDKFGRFHPVYFAKQLLKDFHFKTTRDDETLYVYDWTKGIYENLGEVFVKQQMVSLLDDETRHRHLADVLFFIKGSTYFDRENNPMDKIAADNGILNVVTKELTPHTPEMFITTRIPVTYDAKAKCPAILKFLKEVVSEEQLLVIQEMFGYCLYKDMPFHKSLMLIGDGANGKSTLLELLKKMLGAENVSNATLQGLCYNRFATAQLHEKLANICADIPDSAIKHTGTFKMLTGNDTIEAEQKFKNPFSFKNHAKLIFSANKAPETLDDTFAFFRRWILISCNNVFTASKRNSNILREIATKENLSGLLNFALEGLERLLKNGGFSITENMEEMRLLYIRKSNSAKAFIEEQLMYDPESYMLVSKLYELYILFCRKNKLPSKQKRDLTINMQQHLPRARKIQKRFGDKRFWVWQNVSVTSVTTTLLNHIHSNKQREIIESSVTKEKEESMKSISISKGPVTLVTNTTCPICHFALLEDQEKLEWEGRIAHKTCIEEIRKGRKD